MQYGQGGLVGGITTLQPYSTTRVNSRNHSRIDLEACVITGMLPLNIAAVAVVLARARVHGRDQREGGRKCERATCTANRH
jgi:hypothetical protein